MSADEIFDKGITEFNLGNFKKALVFFEKTLEADPQHVLALIKKGNIFGKLGRYPEAISSYDVALSIEPQNALALVNKGLALHYLQRYDEAISCYDEALQQKPESAVTLYNKASSLICQNRALEGLTVLKHVISLDFSYKYKARFDPDFENIRKSSDFKRMVL